MTQTTRVSVGAFVLTGVLALAAPSARASDVECSVPFSFTVNAKTLPPGSYRVSTDPAQGLMQVRGLDDGVFTLTSHLDVTADAHAKLVFHKYGDEYVLREVWTGDGVASELAEPRRERDLRETARSGGGQAVAQVALAAARSTRTTP